MIMHKCQDGRGFRHDAPAEGYLTAPDGQRIPGPGMCQAHAAACIAEYADKLREVWTFVHKRVCRGL